MVSFADVCGVVGAGGSMVGIAVFFQFISMVIFTDAALSWAEKRLDWGHTCLIVIEIIILLIIESLIAGRI